MKNQNRAVAWHRHLLRMAVVATLLLSTAPTTGIAKSLYVIAQITSYDFPVPVHAYDVGPDGKLTFQTKYGIPFRGTGVLGLAVDSNSECLFVTYEDSNRIQVLDATTMTDIGVTVAPNARNLAGIVFDHEKGYLYCVDRRTDSLYCYLWKPMQRTLTHVPGSPFVLQDAEAYGIALDEGGDLLYVANATKEVTVYSTLDWSLTRRIRLSEIAISVAIDPKRAYLYTGAGFADLFSLRQYNLTTGSENQIQADPEAGVMGLGVDPGTGLVYCSTGRNNRVGGDDLLVFDTALQLIDVVEDIGNPTGLTIPDRQTSYNPLHLAKTIKQGAQENPEDGGPPYVTVGEEFTYSICFDSNVNDLRDIMILDVLPREVTFVRANGDGVFGQYDPETHRYLWRNPPLSEGPRMCLELVVRVKPTTMAGAVITNLVTLDTNLTPPTTIGVEAIATGTGYGYNALNVSKSVVATWSPDTDVQAPSGTAYAEAGDSVIYRICFDNSNNEVAMSNVFVIDVLPGETTFVSADGDGKYGQYDPSTHTYTWSYPSLGPRDSNCVEIVVQLDERVGAGTTVTNNVMAAADETPEASDSADVIIGDEFLRLSKMVVSGAVEDPNTKGKLYVSAGDDITYAVCVGNPSKDRTLTRLSIVDTLPEQVRFVTADGDGQFGYYDPNTHTYTWFYGSLEPGMETCLRLVVRVKEAVEPNVVITNTVTVEGKQTAPVTTVVDVVTRIRSLQAEMFIKPTRFFRATSSQPTSLIVTLFLPEGYGKEHIADTPLVLSPGSIRATSQQIFGTSSQGKIFAFFDRAEFLAATKGYGQFKVTATGRLLSGGSFGGDATVTILGSDKL